MPNSKYGSSYSNSTLILGSWQVVTEILGATGEFTTRCYVFFSHTTSALKQLLIYCHCYSLSKCQFTANNELFTTINKYSTHKQCLRFQIQNIYIIQLCLVRHIVFTIFRTVFKLDIDGEWHPVCHSECSGADDELSTCIRRGTQAEDVWAPRNDVSSWPYTPPTELLCCSYGRRWSDARSVANGSLSRVGTRQQWARCTLPIHRSILCCRVQRSAE